MKRIQRKRVKGWRMPKNAISVTRPGKWGNPLMLDGDTIYIHAGYRRKILSPWVILVQGGDIEEGDLMFWFREIARYNKYTEIKSSNPDLQYWSDHFASLDWNELKGKDLACFCSLDKKCHADVLIEICNEKFKDDDEKLAVAMMEIYSRYVQEELTKTNRQCQYGLK